MGMGVIPLFNNSDLSTDFEIVSTHPELPALDAIAKSVGVTPLGGFFEWDPECDGYTYHDSADGMKSLSALIHTLKHDPPATIATDDARLVEAELTTLHQLLTKATEVDAQFVLAAVY